jgi:hypothetical protein
MNSFPANFVLLILGLLCVLLAGQSAEENGELLNDFHFVSIIMQHNQPNFSLHLSTLPTWKTRLESFFREYGSQSIERVEESVVNVLKEHVMEDFKLEGDWPQDELPVDLHLSAVGNASRRLTTSYVLQLLADGIVWNSESLFLTSKYTAKHRKYPFARQSPNSDRSAHTSILDMIQPRKLSILPSFLREIASPIVLYQSLNTSTGGTTAMRLLYHALKEMQFQHVTLCNETNHLTRECRRPSG